MADKPRILHVVANYPDGVFKQNTTEAVKNLVDATSHIFEHIIVSIYRVYSPFQERTLVNNNIISISYFGLPAVIGQCVFFSRLSNRIYDELKKHNLDFEIIHGHKLSVEAIVAKKLHLKSKKPFVVTIRGFTDSRIMRFRPDLHDLYKNILSCSSAVFIPAPWTKNIINHYLSLYDLNNNITYTCLPNIVKSIDLNKKPGQTSSNFKFVTIFREGLGKNKGFKEILKSINYAKSRNIKIFLDVIGCTHDSEEFLWVKKLGLTEQVSFLGKIDNYEAINLLRHYRGLLLPTKSDTFGMVYTEALLNGVPVLYSANTGIDGYLDHLDVGIRIDPSNQDSINAGILLFDKKADVLRQNLARELELGNLDFFRKPKIVETYELTIRKILGI